MTCLWNLSRSQATGLWAQPTEVPQGTPTCYSYPRVPTTGFSYLIALPKQPPYGTAHTVRSNMALNNIGPQNLNSETLAKHRMHAKSHDICQEKQDLEQQQTSALWLWSDVWACGWLLAKGIWPEYVLGPGQAHKPPKYALSYTQAPVLGSWVLIMSKGLGSSITVQKREASQWGTAVWDLKWVRNKLLLCLSHDQLLDFLLQYLILPYTGLLMESVYTSTFQIWFIVYRSVHHCIQLWFTVYSSKAVTAPTLDWFSP